MLNNFPFFPYHQGNDTDVSFLTKAVIIPVNIGRLSSLRS